jgi:hypothetical protein
LNNYELSGEKCRGHIGKNVYTKTHFSEEYIVRFTDNTFVHVYVIIQHGVNEKNNHRKATKIAKENFPNLKVRYTDYWGMKTKHILFEDKNQKIH